MVPLISNVWDNVLHCFLFLFFISLSIVHDHSLAFFYFFLTFLNDEKRNKKGMGTFSTPDLRITSIC